MSSRTLLSDHVYGRPLSPQISIQNSRNWAPKIVGVTTLATSRKVSKLIFPSCPSHIVLYNYKIIVIEAIILTDNPLPLLVNLLCRINAAHSADLTQHDAVASGSERL